MPHRLDMQRPPSRVRGRTSSRNYTRGYSITPHASWGNALKVSPSKGAATNGDVFPPETTITASDGTNAGRLAGLGFVASPTTNWTSGQKITVGTFDFNWNGSAWAAGAHA